MEDLNTTQASGAQYNTGDPQTGGSSEIQPGTPVDALESSGSGETNAVQMQVPEVTSIQVGTVSEATANPATNGEGTSIGVGALSVLLFLTAAVLIINILKGSNNTTK